MERPQYLLDIPAEEYHAATKQNMFTTSHRLNQFRRCPALYKKIIDGEIVDGDTAAFQLGRATHTFILEGQQKFFEEYTVSDGPENEKTNKPFGKATKAYQEWLATQTNPVISTEDYAQLQKMRQAVFSHPVAQGLLKDGIAEGTVRASWNGEAVQSRLDWFDPEHGILVDLKTCADLDRFQFDVRDHGYVLQMAFYTQILSLAGCTKQVEPYLVAVEKKEPYRVAVIAISWPVLNEANESLSPNSRYGVGNAVCIEELQRCRASDTWPTRYEEIIVL